MENDQLAVRLNAPTISSDHRAEYLQQLVAPMDDMWAAFADMADPHGLMVGNDVAGFCCVDRNRRLLRFYVKPRYQHRSEKLLRCALRELDVACLIVYTLDPNYLSTALDIATHVASHSLLFSHATEPQAPALGPLRLAEADDHDSIVDFQALEIGAPRDFLNHYVGQRLERSEVLLYESDGDIICAGELRRDQQQAGISQLRLIVRKSDRGKGIGTQMLSSLVTRSRDEGLAPYCSTEITNLGARRAIERVGFRARHRVLRVEFEV